MKLSSCLLHALSINGYNSPITWNILSTILAIVVVPFPGLLIKIILKDCVVSTFQLVFFRFFSYNEYVVLNSYKIFCRFKTNDCCQFFLRTKRLLFIDGTELNSPIAFCF